MRGDSVMAIAMAMAMAVAMRDKTRKDEIRSDADIVSFFDDGLND